MFVSLIIFYIVLWVVLTSLLFRGILQTMKTYFISQADLNNTAILDIIKTLIFAQLIIN